MGTGDHDPTRTGSSDRAWRLGCWLAAVALCTLGAALAAPEWVPRQWSREDGPIEYATFAAFSLAAVVALATSLRQRRAGQRALLALLLGAVLFVAAGEEVSWGQRWFGLDTPEVLVDGNHQDELNLHNVDGLQDKAVFAQLGIACVAIALAWRGPRPWARASLPFVAGYLAYRGGRGVAAVAGWGAADRNSEAAELLLALGLLALVIALGFETFRRAPAPGRLRARRGATARPRPSPGAAAAAPPG